MDVKAVKKALRSFARRNRLTFGRLASRQSQVLELGALIGTVRHFQSAGFALAFHNPGGGRRFKVKASTRGHPWMYSRISVTKNGERYEIHSNLLTRGARDDGIYCVDVGIAKDGIIPLQRPSTQWTALNNSDLVSFVEAKRLVIYPMLLAQFLGIVHEIRPEFLATPAPTGFGPMGVVPPAMVALGGYSSNAGVIVQGFGARGFTFLVVPQYDYQLSRCREDPSQSPFYRPDGSAP